MSWPMVKLGSVGEFKAGFGFPVEYQGKKEGDYPFAKVGDISAVVRSGHKNIFHAGNYIDKDILGNLKAKTIPKGTIVFAKIGEAIKQNFRAVTTVEMVIDNNVMGLVPDNNLVDTNYLFYFMRSLDLYQFSGATTIPALRKSMLENIQIPLPPLSEQKRIAAILDKADSIRQKREQAINLADNFLRATFFEMFGDPVENSKGWDVASLLEYGSFKNGMNFSKGESGSALKCLGVGDFKALATITCMDNIGEIELNTSPSADYLLNDGDIVFVRSNGNKALVGRCLTIYPGKEKVTFSGFCIRYRIEKSAIKPEYLNFLFRTPSMKQQMLSGGQGANIQNISQGTLSTLRIPVPPLEKQLAFSKVVSFHSALMKKLDVNTVETEDMFGSISQQYFN